MQVAKAVAAERSGLRRRWCQCFDCFFNRFVVNFCANPVEVLGSKRCRTAAQCTHPIASFEALHHAIEVDVLRLVRRAAANQSDAVGGGVRRVQADAADGVRLLRRRLNGMPEAVSWNT